MAEQYFQAQPSAQSRERRIQVRLGETSLRFFTDNATFSKEHLDEGSRILLEALPPLGGRVADLGCGWGPIGCFAAAKNPEAELLLLDVNQRAAELARRNILENGLKNAAARAGDIVRVRSRGGSHHLELVRDIFFVCNRNEPF